MGDRLALEVLAPSSTTLQHSGKGCWLDSLMKCELAYRQHYGTAGDSKSPTLDLTQEIKNAHQTLHSNPLPIIQMYHNHLL